jgi:hypothetical protein
MVKEVFMAKKSKIFDDEAVSEYDQMEEEIDQQAQAVDDILEDYEAEPEEDEEEEEEPAPKAKAKKLSSAYRMNAAESGIMSSAMVQLEQAKLYDMFLKHNLFDGVKANPEALKRVEQELKDFILERLQILLGMKQEKKVQQVQQFKVELPFNNVEIEFLKALSLKGTGGASANVKPAKVNGLSSIKNVEEDDEEEEEKPQSLKSIGQKPSRKVYEEPEEEEEEDEEPAPAPRKKIPQPVKKKVSKVIVTDEEVAIERKRLAKTGVRFTDDEIRAAKEDIKKMAKRDKPAHLMSEDELREEAKRNKREKPIIKGAIPMPNADAQLSHYMTQQMRNQSSNPDNSALMGLLSKKLGFSTTGVHNDTSNGDE